MGGRQDRVVLQTELPGLEPRRRGKVRDIYDAADGLVIVATDRISAFDVVMPNGIPGKGIVLTQLSRFWFERLAGVVDNHVISTDVEAFPEPFRVAAGQLVGRSMYVRRAERFDVECVVRGYLIGSGWRDYRSSGAVCGIRLPEGLRLAERLPEPVFTPATKAEDGHDQNIDLARMKEIVGEDWAERMAETSLRLYREAAEYARERGIIIADTKFEFGLVDGELILIDEVLTPDSSRFWPADAWQPGQSPPSFDKQFVRDWLETLDWNKTAPGPELPDEIVRRTGDKYREAYQRLTGEPLPDFGPTP